jgi:hypothetical protein
MMLFSKPSTIHCSSTMNGIMYLFLLVILLGPTLSSCSEATSGGIQSTPASEIQILCSIQNNNANSAIRVTVDHSSPVGVSQFSPGISLIDDSLNYPWNNNDPGAVNSVKSLIGQGLQFENTPIMAWGAPDPWPVPSQPEPSDWGYLDGRLQLILQSGGIPVITLSEAPWWMKGQLEPDGSTRLLQPSDEWSNIAYSSRILDNKMGAWLHLVQRVAERYMVAPYNVRYFQVWNELKGYYNPITNAYDYTTSPGDPGGPNATHGYTYMYNLVYDRLTQVARSLGIPTDSIKIGGPYVVMDTWGSKYQSTLSNLSKAYGTYDQRSLDVVLYWLQHKAGAGFITLDSSNSNRDNINLVDPFVAADKFGDMVVWIRSLDNARYPGAATLPTWLAEWYAMPYGNTADDQYDDAIKSYTVIKFLKAGGSVALLWGGLSNGPSDTGLWTPTTAAAGGQPLPWYYSYKAFKDYFAPGTEIYKTIVSAPESVEALASASHIMLVNKTTKNLTASVDGSVVALSPYQVCVGTL